jgi:hypothetical protein
MTTAATATTIPEPDLKSMFLALMPSALPWQPEDTEELKDARESRRNDDKAATPSPDESKGRGAEVLIPFMDEFPLYLNESGESLILFDGRLCNLDPKNKELAEDLGLFYHEKTGKPLSKDAASTSISLYSAKARRDGIPIELFNRSGEKDGLLYYDLGNGRTVEIKPGSWRIITDALFMKLYNHQQPQPDPLPGGDAWKLFNFIRVPEESRLLCLATIATCFIARINHPAISISGPQGSGKSFAQSIIKQLVDPSCKILSLMPRKVEELPLVLSQRHMTALDNQSSFSGEVADLLCAAITGGVLEKRVLHSDAEMMSLRVPGIITYSAITSVSDRPDLHERTVRIVLDRIPPQKRRTEKPIWREFNEALPSILGGIFDLIAKAMIIHPEVEERLLELPRMADFACWAFSVCEALPGGRGSEFLLDYTGNASIATADLLEHNSFFSAIIQAMERDEPLEGTFAEILAELKNIIDPDGEKGGHKSLEKDGSFPKAPQGFRGKLERLKMPLEDLGVTYTVEPNKTNRGKVLCRFFKRAVTAPDPPAAALNDLVFDDGEIF